MAAQKPPAKKKLKPGHATVSVVINAEFNEEKWREFCSGQGIDLSGQVIQAHFARSLKAAAYAQLKLMGFPQEES